MSAERLYRGLLRLYPRSFRVEYEREMVRLFQEQLRFGSDKRLVRSFEIPTAKGNGYRLYFTTGDEKDAGINGGLLRPREGQSPGTINTIAVPSLDETTKKIEQRGGKICVPKMAIPKMGWLAYAEDPAGNVFGLMEPDTSAR